MLTDRERTIYAVLVNIIGGLLVGYAIGYVPVAFQMHTYIGNCTRYQTQPACGEQQQLCRWSTYDNHSFCDFKDSPDPSYEMPTGCGYIREKSACNADNASQTYHCLWQQASGWCAHDDQWTSWEVGLYAAMMIVGGMFGSFAAPVLLARQGHRTLIALTGLLGTVAVGLLIVGWQVDTGGKLGSYPLMAIGRLVIGIAVGFASVVCPMYCGDMAPSKNASAIGCTFQLAVTFGIFLASFAGFIIENTIDLREVSHGKAKFQAMNAVNLLFAAALIPVAWVVRDPPDENDAATTINEEDNAKEDRGLIESTTTIPLSSLKRNFAIAIALAAAQQLTGINAIMNYAPSITAKFGLQPLTGNMLVMLWNFLTTISSIPLAKRMSAGRMYCMSAMVASLACLLTAIPVFPTVTPDANDKASSALAAVGIFLFVAAFETGMGPAFYVLAQSIFPLSRRSLGCSFTLIVQFIFNLIINFCYPVAVESLSGGPTGDQRLGMACVFVFFGVVGFVCTSALAWNLHKSSQMKQREETLE